MAHKCDLLAIAAVGYAWGADVPPIELDLHLLLQSRNLDDVGCSEGFPLTHRVEDVPGIENALAREPNADLMLAPS